MDTPRIDGGKEPPKVKLLKRIQTFSDEELTIFLAKKVKRYPNGKNWLRFRWRDAVRFFGLKDAFKVTRTLGGKCFYPATVCYKSQKRSLEDNEIGNPKWRRIDREELKKSIGEDATRLIYKYLKQTYISIPRKTLFEVNGNIYFDKIQEKTEKRLIKISNLLTEGLAKKVIADRLKISPQQLVYYINKYQKILFE